MSDPRLREAGTIVAHLSRALLDGSRDLRTVPNLVKRIIEHKMWREWEDPASGRVMGFPSFAAFVEGPATDGGLGSTIDQLYGLCESDTEARNAIDQATQGTHGGDRRSSAFNVDNVHVERPSGNAESAALRRLRKDRPDLHARVLAEEISANWAMVEAKFRPKTISVPVTRPDAVARSLLKHMSADDIAQLIAVLVGAAPLSDHQGDGAK